MKDALQHASDILEAHWNRPADMRPYTKDALEILKAEIKVFRKCTLDESKRLDEMFGRAMGFTDDED